MPKCEHTQVTITVEWAERCHMTSVDPETITGYVTHVQPAAMGPIRPEGYWSRAHFYVRCHDCGQDATFTSADWRQFPKWLQAHWRRLVATGGLPEKIQKHYRMFEEAPCNPA